MALISFEETEKEKKKYRSLDWSTRQPRSVFSFYWRFVWGRPLWPMAREYHTLPQKKTNKAKKQQDRVERTFSFDFSFFFLFLFFRGYSCGGWGGGLFLFCFCLVLLVFFCIRRGLVKFHCEELSITVRVCLRVHLSNGSMERSIEVRDSDGGPVRFGLELLVYFGKLKKTNKQTNKQANNETPRRRLHFSSLRHGTMERVEENSVLEVLQRKFKKKMGQHRRDSRRDLWNPSFP